MGDSIHNPGSSEMMTAVTSKSVSRKCSLACSTKSSAFQSLRPITLLKRKIGCPSAGQLAIFLLEVAALETVRRFSRAKCPFIWSGLQALQVLCYPPFKWIHRWTPFRFLAKGMQLLSKPLLVLSVATAFADHSESSSSISDGCEDSQGPDDSHALPESPTESTACMQSTPNTMSHEVCQSSSSMNWLIELRKELEEQGIVLPQRVNEELQRFYNAANGDFSCLLASVKKTICWREHYTILSAKELEIWSNLVFWHGCDVQNRPCLFVRLGLAISSLPFCDRPRFAQAVVSQVEHGILNLVNIKSPEITVLVDCEGQNPPKFPMQMVRSCCTLLQDHFPERLGRLVIMRLPPDFRVAVQTLIEALKPVTRQKLIIEEEMNRNSLSKYLKMLPSYLDGVCTCERCAKLMPQTLHHSSCTNQTEPDEGIDGFGTSASVNPIYEVEMLSNNSCERVLRTAIVGVLIFWVFITLIAGIYDSE